MIVVVLTLVAAALSAVSAAGEHRAAARLRGPRMRTRVRASRPIAIALALLATPLWLGSWALDAVGTLVQAAALHLGSLTVVQPLMVATLLFTLPLAAMGRRTRLSLRDWAGTAAVAVGLALVLGTRSPADDAEQAGTGGRLIVVMLAVAVVATVLVGLSRNRSPSMRAMLLSIAAGSLFAVGAATTKLTAAIAASAGLPGVLTSWAAYALAAVSITSFGLQQAAYAAGPLATAMTAVVVTDPLVSYVVGVVGFGEPMPAVGFPLALSTLGMVVLCLGVASLSHSPLLQPSLPRPNPAAVSTHPFPLPGHPVAVAQEAAARSDAASPRCLQTCGPAPS
jgi:drug/metabolite transporter (DMT)-like permease